MAARTKEVDGKLFVEDAAEGWLEVKYGLPPEVAFCSACVVSNQRATPSVVIQDRRDSKKTTIPFADGVCQACDVVGQKEQTDWEARERRLVELLDKHRSRNGSYDCVVPGSGGKDSVFQAHILKSKYCMNPLTVTWAPHLYTEVGWRNFTNWIHTGGFDNFLLTPDGQVHRKLTELAYRSLLHPFQPFIFGQRHFAMRIARQLGLKLIFYGESHVEYGGRAGEEESAALHPRYYTGDAAGEIYVSGLPIDELRRHGITRQKLVQYLPLTEEECRAAGIEVYYLGHFLKWVPQQNYYYAVEHAGFEANTERTEGTYSKYNSIDDKLDGFHYWCGHVKFGIGRCTHEAGQEIRHGHITREEGVALVRKYDGEFPERYFPEVLDYMGMERAEFLEIADSFRSPHLWRKTGNGWQLRHVVS
ncbi:MAG: N-acetyl sugar amidotransferase [Rhodospirillales bacterium]|nr:N-acetyl sugar amidotransferase [Rhodospirillales bacterium]